MANRIKNLKYNPRWADLPKRGYSHLEFLDGIMSISEARSILEYELQHNKTRTLDIIERVEKKKPNMATDEADQ